MTISKQRGAVEVKECEAKACRETAVIWRFKSDDFKEMPHGECVCQTADFLGLQLKPQLYPAGYENSRVPVFRMMPPASAGHENCTTSHVQVRINGWCGWNGAISPGGIVQFSYSNGCDIFNNSPEIEIQFHSINGQNIQQALPGLLKSALEKETQCKQRAEGRAKRLGAELETEKGKRQLAEGEAKRLGVELGQEKTCREASEAEVNRLSALINAETEQAAERECHFVHSAVKIQATWKGYVQRQRFLRERAERAWRSKQDKFRPETSYDAIFAFDSLAKFLEKGKIEFLQNAESELQIAKESKTWLLNELFGANLPSGKLYTTKGLSFLWIKERRMLIIDSAGVQSPVSHRQEAVDAIHDAQTTEISHHMVFVVNDLTWYEQKYIERLRSTYELIVVHNLRTTKDVLEATQLFSRQVMMSYDGEPSHLGDLIFTADLGNGTLPVRHVGLCYEFSEAGDAFNEKNREYLIQSLEHGNALGEHVLLTDRLALELSNLMPNFVSVTPTDPVPTDPPTDPEAGVFQKCFTS
eukprot:Skav223912  [mRNA]  locus=scaffold2593:156071:158993:- [translate_table: standard]